jgi:hypothetical protein
MSVGDLLGLDENSELLDQARARWAAWAADDARLRVVDDFVDLRDWLSTVERVEADMVLLGLAMLGAPDGGDEVAAAGALAKCLLPGACVTAERICQLVARGQLAAANVDGPVGQRVDELVASQLWIEVRTFPWRRLTKVASNILMNTRAGVLYELGDNARLWRTDRTWANTSALEAVTRGDFPPARLGSIDGDPGTGCRELTLAGFRPELFTGAMPSPDADPERTRLEQLLEILAWACEHRVITTSDRHLLLVLVEEAARVKTSRTGRGRCGLVGNELSLRVAPRLGVSGATVRRRAARSMAALAAAVPERFVGHE